MGRRRSLKRRAEIRLLVLEAVRRTTERKQAEMGDVPESSIQYWMEPRFRKSNEGRLRVLDFYNAFRAYYVHYKRPLDVFGSWFVPILNRLYQITAERDESGKKFWRMETTDYKEDFEEEILDEVDNIEEPEEAQFESDDPSSPVFDITPTPIYPQMPNQKSAATHIRNLQTPSKWPNYSKAFSEEFAQEARKKIIRDKCAPPGIRKLAEAHFDVSQETIGGMVPLPVFVTAQRRKELEEFGVTVIENVFSQQEIDLCKESLKASLDVNSINRDSYQYLCRNHGMPGIVTKHGWTKVSYLTPTAQMLSLHPNVWTIASELYGVSRLATNFYECKACFPQHDKCNKLEFVHADVNYEKSLLLEAAGYQWNLFYQMIAPLTDMVYPGPTVFFGAGVHKSDVWGPAVTEALQKNTWRRGGWKTCNPGRVIPKLLERMRAAHAKAGSLVVFHPNTPHAPNINASVEMRLASYIFIGPLLEQQNPAKPDETATLLPNSQKEVIASLQSGSCPRLSADPLCYDEIQLAARSFVSAAPYIELPRSVLGNCIIGAKAWCEFEVTSVANSLLSLPPNDPLRATVIEQLQRPALDALSHYILQLKTHLSPDLHNQTQCIVCARTSSFTDEQYWHTSEAAYHRQHNLDHCLQCQRVRTLSQKWSSFSDKGGCSCPSCVQRL